MKTPDVCCANKRSFIDTLDSVNNVLEGWGNQYRYCTDKKPIEEMDRCINEYLRSYFAYYWNCIKVYPGEDFVNKRRLLGVHLLIDSLN